MFGKFSIYGADTTKVLKNNKLPILLIHGANDGFVPCEMSKAAFDADPHNVRLVLVDGADHGLSYLINKELVEKEINSFLTKKI